MAGKREMSPTVVTPAAREARMPSCVARVMTSLSLSCGGAFCRRRETHSVKLTGPVEGGIMLCW